MKPSKLIRESGPYTVISRPNGELSIMPKWPQFPEYNDEDGGGPGINTRFNLAHDIEELLNSSVPFPRAL